MKKLSVYIFLFYFLSCGNAIAGTTATNTLTTIVVGAITFNITGNFSTTIDSTTGNLATGLNINYGITSNSNVNNLQLKAVVTDSTGIKQNAFYSPTNTTSFYLVFGNSTYPPTAAAISNCQQATSTATSNANAIAYPGTVTIDNTGVINYSTSYYSFLIKKNTTNLNLSLSTVSKPGTYDVTTALDEPGPYQVELYIDNIP